MKYSLALALTLFCLSFSAQAQQVGGGGGGGYGMEFLRTLFAGEKPCLDGALKDYYEWDSERGSHIQITRTCHKGRFIEKSNVDYRKIRCSEGTVGSGDEINPVNGNTLRKTFRCINGVRTLIRVEEISRTDG